MKYLHPQPIWGNPNPNLYTIIKSEHLLYDDDNGIRYGNYSDISTKLLAYNHVAEHNYFPINWGGVFMLISKRD